ncbi:hypothetical protein [Paracoccus sp. 08]|uniref:hypothetical protein n=1 Tax=Paracoccus sp. 08 TaxID=2606624 RepID=UPI0020963B7E|nr:hypothetical protein [Paracoccus sp. 08]MCO6361899.1 hypothetical protein [Paracoccus sp. 08]
MAKEENIDDLLAQLKEHDEQQAKIREKIKASAVGEAESIKEKINSISSLSGISKFDLLGITKEEVIRHFKIRQRADNKQNNKVLSGDEKIIKEYKTKNPKKEFPLSNGGTYNFKKKGPMPNEVKEMILAEVAGIAPE